MGESKADDVKGRVKEAAGVITGDEDLEREGKADQAGAKVKETAEKVEKKIDDAVDAVKEKL
jgi:uncharacterized protein YjbJ (UPF0337 family)